MHAGLWEEEVEREEETIAVRKRVRKWERNRWTEKDNENLYDIEKSSIESLEEIIAETLGNDRVWDITNNRD